MNSFRLRFNVSPRAGIRSEERRITLFVDESDREVFLQARNSDGTIYDDTKLVLRSEGWPSEASAREAGEKYRDALMFALARSRVGVDLGNRAAKGAFTDAGLAMLEEQEGRRVLNDVHGLMTFSTEPPPLFVDQELKGKRGTPPEPFVAAFSEAAKSNLRMTDPERLSFEFFSASFFTDYADARFLLLFMAFEALLDQKERGRKAVELVERIEGMVADADGLEQADKTSLLGSIRWLRVQSIRQAGKELAREVGRKDYNGMSGEELFIRSYEVRNRLVHGHSPAPSWSDVGGLAAQLEVLVSDLICRPVPAYDS